VCGLRMRCHEQNREPRQRQGPNGVSRLQVIRACEESKRIVRRVRALPSFDG
jgi:hypothetical protein